MKYEHRCRRRLSTINNDYVIKIRVAAAKPAPETSPRQLIPRRSTIAAARVASHSTAARIRTDPSPPCARVAVNGDNWTIIQSVSVSLVSLIRPPAQGETGQRHTLTGDKAGSSVPRICKSPPAPLTASASC